MGHPAHFRRRAADEDSADSAVHTLPLMVISRDESGKGIASRGNLKVSLPVGSWRSAVAERHKSSGLRISGGIRRSGDQSPPITSEPVTVFDGRTPNEKLMFVIFQLSFPVPETSSTCAVAVAGAGASFITFFFFFASFVPIILGLLSDLFANTRMSALPHQRIPSSQKREQPLGLYYTGREPALPRRELSLHRQQFPELLIAQAQAGGGDIFLHVRGR